MFTVFWQAAKKRMEEIRQIHKESHEIYGAPKTAKKMREKGDTVSDKTVGNFMRDIGIKACYIKKQSIKTIIQPVSKESAGMKKGF